MQVEPPRLKPSADPISLGCLEDSDHIPPLPVATLATWGRLAMVRFYNAHQELKQDLLHKPDSGVSQLRFRTHCEHIPLHIRQLHNIKVHAGGICGVKEHGRIQSLQCQKIDELLNTSIAFWRV